MEWKETYGKGTKEEALKLFREKFDDKAYSVWHGEKPFDYYPLSSNAESYVQGTMERMAALHKHMHAMFLIHDKDGTLDYQHSVLIISKGTSLIFNVSLKKYF